MPRPGVIVVSRPDFEPATHYGAAWFGVVVEEAKRRGFTVVDLYGDAAVRSEVEKALASMDPILFTGVGHGNATTFTGQRLDRIFVACENDNLLADRVVYLLSCYTGLKLGPSMVRKGCRSYVGYFLPYVFVINRRYLDRPLDDPFARAFMEQNNEIVLALLDGDTVHEAILRSAKTAWKWIKYWERQGTTVGALIAAILHHDIVALTQMGEEWARITAPRRLGLRGPLALAALGAVAALSTVLAPPPRRSV